MTESLTSALRVTSSNKAPRTNLSRFTPVSVPRITICKPPITACFFSFSAPNVSSFSISSKVFLRVLYCSSNLVNSDKTVFVLPSNVSLCLFHASISGFFSPAILLLSFSIICFADFISAS